MSSTITESLRTLKKFFETRPKDSRCHHFVHDIVHYIVHDCRDMVHDQRDIVYGRRGIGQNLRDVVRDHRDVVHDHRESSYTEVLRDQDRGLQEEKMTAAEDLK
ncbi:uncharacterized, partial [Lates japonicus]